MKTQRPGFVVCVRNDGFADSLEPWKIYRVLRDSKAGKHELVRVIDESGEDYLFPAAYFLPIAVPQAVRAAMLARAS